MKNIKKVGKGRVFEVSSNIIEDGFYNYFDEYFLDDYEVDMLILGMEIKIISSDDKAILIRLVEKENKGHLKHEIEVAIPMIFLSHEFTENERKLLYRGEELEIDDFYDPKIITTFKGRCKWDEDNKKIVLTKRF